MLFSGTMRPRIRNDDLSDAGWNNLRDWFGLTDELDIRGKKSLQEITVYTCIRIRAEALGKLPLKIYQDTDGRRKAADHYLYPLLKLRPNPYMSAMDFWKCLSVQCDVYGNAYAYMDVGRSGAFTGFYPMDSARMRIYVDDVGLISSKQTIWYIFTDLRGKQYKFQPDELLHFKGLSTDGISGMNPIETLRSSIENAKQSSGFLNSSYKKGMTSGGIVHYIGDLDEKAKESFRTKFEKMAAGLKNANRISMLPVGYNYQPIELKLTDAQFMENSRFTIQQLTAAFGIKPHQVNDQTKTSYASTAEANREFYADTLLSLLTSYEQELNWKLFTASEIRQGYYTKFNADVILRGDTEKRYEMYQKAVYSGTKTPNECRALEEDEPLEGGNELYGNAALVPLKYLATGATLKKGGSGA
jgi:HK97 family phage portal protein